MKKISKQALKIISLSTQCYRNTVCKHKIVLCNITLYCSCLFVFCLLMLKEGTYQYQLCDNNTSEGTDDTCILNIFQGNLFYLRFLHLCRDVCVDLKLQWIWTLDRYIFHAKINLFNISIPPTFFVQLTSDLNVFDVLYYICRTGTFA